MQSVVDQIENCRACILSSSRTRTVPGEGPVPCRIMLIGEGPGQKEDKSGRPFVGRAGTILTGLLSDTGLSRDYVFITSVVKCRPPKNRAPGKEEIASCIPHLAKQVEILSPRVIVTMGRIATAAVFTMLDIQFPSFKEVRGKIFHIPGGKNGSGIWVIPVYHPAVITHNPPARSTLEEDFRRLGELLEQIRAEDLENPAG